jgi:hypothetical protein
MPKKSKQKKSVKQIPAKAGAKAKVGSGGKVEVVLKTTKVVKDARRGKYKPRKKTNKKQDASKKQKDALSVLREQIELEKIQALQRQSQQQQLQLSQRIPNRRTSGDINQFYSSSKNTGKKEVESDLVKEVKKLREELKKKDEKAVEKPAEEKSKFKQELETTQNEIQRLRIQRGIAKRDEEQREKNLQAQIDRVEKDKKTEQSRLRVANRKLRSEKTAREQAQKSVFQDKEEEFKIQESLTRAKRKELQKEIKRQPPNTRPTVIDASGNILGLKLTDRSKEREEKIAKDLVGELIGGAERRIEKRNKPKPPTALQEESDKNKSKKVKQALRDGGIGISQRTIETKPTPTPEPEPTPQRFVVGGAGGTEVPFSSQEELLQAFRNRKNKPRPLPREKTPTEVKSDIISSLDNQPKLAKERNRERLVQQNLQIIRDEAEDDTGFETAEEEEPISIPSSGSASVPDEEPIDIDTKEEPQILKPVVEEPVSEETKKRRESFLEEVKSPEVEQQVKQQLSKDKLREEAEKLRELQESGDKAYQDRIQAQVDIQEDERVARDLLLQQQRQKDFDKQKLEDSMRLLKEKKQREKKKARDNLRKREQEEFLDETAGEIIRGAVEQNVGERAEAREKASRKLVGNVFSNVVGGRALASEIITATQNIPRSSRTDRYSEEATRERVGDLLHSDYTGIGRKAYTEEEAITKDENQKFAKDIKVKLALAVPEIIQKNYTKEMKHRTESGLANRLQAQINEDMEKVRESGNLLEKN